MVKYIRNSLVLAKVESSYGSDASPSATNDAIEAGNIDFKYTPEELERNIHISSHSPRPPLKGLETTEVTFQVELRGSGTPGTAPRIGALLQACAFSESVSAGSSVTYTPASNNLKSITLYVWKDGRKHIVTGAVGTAKFTLAAGKIPVIDFTFNGIYTAPSDVSNPTPDYGSEPDPVIVKSINLQYNSISSLVFNQYELDLGNIIAQRPSVNATTGIKGFGVTGRKHVITMDPEAEALATVNYYSDILNTTRAVSLTIGSTTGNICAISHPAAMLTQIAYEDRDGHIIDKITGLASSQSGDDETSIVFS